VALLLGAAPLAAAPGFFDSLPRRGYALEDWSYVVNRTGPGVAREPVATIRLVRLALDPGTRGIATDLWPEREMLLVEHATGERVAFERIVRAPRAEGSDDPVPVGRIGLDGTAVELFARGSGAVPMNLRPRACDGPFDVLVAGDRVLPFAAEELGAPTVREGIARLVEQALGERERELVVRTVQIALRAGSARALPLGSLDILRKLFPGRRFDPWPEALVFDVPAGAPIDPSSGSWRSVTDAPEILQGAPLF
jgi:hypothetical protein